MTPAEFAGMISRVRFAFATEDELQRGIDEVLERAGVAREREKRLSGADRIDFFLPADGMGIEVKIKGSTADLVRQVGRYVQHPEIRCLVVIASRIRLANLPDRMNGKPVRVISLLSGIA